MARHWPHLDWIDRAYRPVVHIGICRAGVVHSFQSGPLRRGQNEALDSLERRIEEGDAAWAVELRCRGTLMCRVETSRNARQEIVWEDRDVAGDVLVTPGVLALREFSLRPQTGSACSAAAEAGPKSGKRATSSAGRAGLPLLAVPDPSFPTARCPVRGGGAFWPKRSGAAGAGGLQKPPPATCSVPTTKPGSVWRARR